MLPDISTTYTNDLPSVCARLLYDGEVHPGLVPSIEYLRSDQYRFVPGVGIGSRGPVASVALFTRRPIGEIRHIALDTSSRTSVALIKVLCHHRFRIQPEYVPHGPDLAAMVRDYDAGLLIGDPALEGDPASHAVTKIDLGAEWTTMTGLPFVYAAWTGRTDRLPRKSWDCCRTRRRKAWRRMKRSPQSTEGTTPASRGGRSCT